MSVSIECIDLVALSSSVRINVPIDSLFTIYEGYFVELIQYHDDYSEQTDADDDFARTLLYGIEFSTDESQAE